MFRVVQPQNMCARAHTQEARLQEEEARQRLRAALVDLDDWRRRVATVPGCLQVVCMRARECGPVDLGLRTSVTGCASEFNCVLLCAGIAGLRARARVHSCIRAVRVPVRSCFRLGVCASAGVRTLVHACMNSCARVACACACASVYVYSCCSVRQKRKQRREMERVRDP